MSRLLLKNGRVMDPAVQKDTIQDLYIADGKILDNPEHFTADQTIDCTNKIVCPGFIDTCARLLPAHQENEITLEHESNAAIANGITTLVCPPDNSKALMDNGITANAMSHYANQVSRAKILWLGALTEKLAGEQLAPFGSLKAAGCVGLTHSCAPIKDTSLLRHCFEYAANFDLPIFIHPQDFWLSQGGVAHEGEVSVRLGLPGIPALSETIALTQALLLQEKTGVALHFTHLTCGESITLLERAKQRGQHITADVALSHLYLTEWDIDGFNVDCHTTPPLRSIADQEALLRGIESGIITSICSNHTPLGSMAKLAPFPSATPGISSFDAFLPLLIGLTHKTSLPLLKLLQLVTQAPAALLNLSAGTLQAGAPADICIFDDRTSVTLSSETMHSNGKNSPFLGWPLQGQVCYTLINGKIAYQSTKS